MKKFQLIGLIAVVIFSSCLQEPDFQQEPLNLDPHRISVEQAIQTMNSAMSQLYIGTRTAKGYSIQTLKGRDLQQAGTRSDGTILPEDVLYIVNFDNEEGFAVLAANDIYEPILAITESGSLSLSDFQPQEISDTISLTPTQLVAGLIADYIKQPVVQDTLYVAESTPLTNSQYKQAWRQIKWHQRAPFNNQCPVIGSKTLAGCVAIATAQIIAYHRYPELSYFTGNSNSNWESLITQDYYKDTYNLTSAEQTNYANMATFVKVVADGVDTKFGVDKSSASVLGLTEWYPSATGYLRELGYSVEMFFPQKYIPYWDLYDIDENSQEFPTKMVCEALLRSKPVLIGAACEEVTSGDEIIFNPPTDDPHAFIIDRGYSLKSIKEATIAPNTTAKFFVHCMWGWERGLANGYYWLEIFNGYGAVLDPSAGPDAIDPKTDNSATTANYLPFVKRFLVVVATPPNNN